MQAKAPRQKKTGERSVMNVLIVDDQIHVVKGAVTGVNWNSLHIRNVYEAFSFQEAREIFLKHDINILICDIEMPYENGIELVTWVKQCYPGTESIFLTSHANFEYAQAAVKLGCFDYLIQPVRYAELEACIQRAVSHILLNRETSELSRYGSYWAGRKESLTKQYLRILLLHGHILDSTELLKDTAALKLPLRADTSVLPVLTSILGLRVPLDKWGPEVMRAAIQMAEDIFKDFGAFCSTVEMDENHFATLIDSRGDTDIMDKVAHCFQMLVDACRNKYSYELACYIGAPASLKQLPTQLKQLRELEAANIVPYSRVFVLNADKSEEEPLDLPDFTSWPQLFACGNHAPILSKISGFLTQKANAHTLTDRTLFALHQVLVQAYYASLDLRDIPASRLFTEAAYSRLYFDACKSVGNMERFLQFIISFNQKLNYIEEKYSITIIGKIKTYIGRNLDKELTRKDIAEHVYLSEDYISHLFKKETGCSLIDYINAEKIEYTKKLLAETNLPLSIITMKAGYSSLSYFSRVFKKTAGVSPAEFRKLSAP